MARFRSSVLQSEVMVLLLPIILYICRFDNPSSHHVVSSFSLENVGNFGGASGSGTGTSSTRNRIRQQSHTISTPPSFITLRQRIQTVLKGKRWDSLELEDDTKPRWYLLNCIAGTEKDCLYQCQKVCQEFSIDDVVKFVVPTEPSVKSRGNKLIQEDMVLYPGYVFAKVRLCEHVYETLSGLGSVRSWMGTIRKLSAASYRTKPSIPTPMSEMEIQQYRGLEDASEEEEEDAIDQYNSTAVVDDGTVVITDNEEDSATYENGDDETLDETVHQLMDQFSHLQIGGMCKITADGPLKNEDGIIKRFKDNLVCVRMYTYGSMFDEWVEPKYVRLLTEDEVRLGMQGPERPITQQQFNVESLGMSPGREHGDTRRLRSSLLGTMSTGRGGNTMAGSTRNRREDRVQRGDTRQRRLDEDALRQERLNWQAYQRKQQGGGNNDNDENLFDVNAQWGRGSRQQPQRERSNARATNTPPLNDDIESRQIEKAMKVEADWSDFLKGAAEQGDTGMDDEVDLFDQLLTELSDTTTSSSGAASGSGSIPPTTQTAEEDNFFSALEESLKEESSLSSNQYQQQPQPQRSHSMPTTTTSVEEDDFFSQLEDELTDMSQHATPTAHRDSSSVDDASTTAGTVSLDHTTTTVNQRMTSTDLSKMTVPMLKEELKQRGLKVGGKKADLIARLTSSETSSP